MNTRLSARRLSAVLVAAAVATAACSATPTASDPGTKPASTSDGGTVPTPVTAAPGQLAIAVNQVRQHRTGTKADALEIAVTLANADGGQAVVLNPGYFKLKSGLLKMPSMGSKAAWVDGTTPALTDALA